MKRTHIRTMVLAALPLFVFVTLLTVRAPKAYAALAGEDGVIISVEQQISFDENENINIDSSVNAVQPDGSNPTVIAEVNYGNYSLITSATVSKPEGTPATQTNTVVYTESVDHCYVNEYEEYEESNERLVLPGGPETQVCEGYKEEPSHQVVEINKVTIDKNGAPQGSPTLVTTIGDDEERHDINVVTNSSFSPDSNYVLLVRYTSDFYDEISEEGMFFNGSLMRIERLTMADGTVEEVVAPVFDYALNGGYAQNGNIYFSRTITEGYDDLQAAVMMPPVQTSDIWVIKAGQPFESATRITNEGDLFYIDASPDNTKLLVQNGKDGYAYVDLTTGCLTSAVFCTITPIDSSLMPAFFSPKGTRVAGITFNYEEMYVRTAMTSVAAPGFMNIAVSSSSNMSTSAVIVSNRTVAGVREIFSMTQLEWAPQLAAATPTTPQVMGVSTTVAAIKPVLSNTGADARLMTLVATAFLGLSLWTVFRRQRS